MYATSRQFIAKAQEEGNPAVIDLICYLHPTHIAFQKAVQVLSASKKVLNSGLGPFKDQTAEMVLF